MLADLERAIRLQILDDRTAALNKEIAALPAHVAVIEKKLEAHQRRLDVDRAALTANQKARKTADLDIQTNQQKISKLKGQMMEAKNNEQYKAFQHEIAFCEQEIQRHEEKILELMAAAEPLDQAVKAAEAALAVERKGVDAEKSVALEKTAADKKEIASLLAERTTILAEMDKKFAAEYERIRKGRAGVAIAEVIGGRCSKCNMLARPQFLQELKQGNSVMVCESCKRILYWNPPKAVADLA